MIVALTVVMKRCGMWSSSLSDANVIDEVMYCDEYTQDEFEKYAKTAEGRKKIADSFTRNYPNYVDFRKEEAAEYESIYG
jgi:hypothetical protein